MQFVFRPILIQACDTNKTLFFICISAWVWVKIRFEYAVTLAPRIEPNGCRFQISPTINGLTLQQPFQEYNFVSQIPPHFSQIGTDHCSCRPFLCFWNVKDSWILLKSIFLIFVCLTSYLMGFMEWLQNGSQKSHRWEKFSEILM